MPKNLFCRLEYKNMKINENLYLIFEKNEKKNRPIFSYFVWKVLKRSTLAKAFFDIFATFFCFHWIQKNRRSRMTSKRTKIDVKITK